MEQTIWYDVGYLIGWAGAAASATYIWTRKGGAWAVGLVLGAALGLVGVLITAVATPNKKAQNVDAVFIAHSRECPHCRQAMRRDASVCHNCRRESQPWQFHQGHWWFQNDTGEMLWLDEGNYEWKRWAQPQPLSA